MNKRIQQLQEEYFKWRKLSKHKLLTQEELDIMNKSCDDLIDAMRAVSEEKAVS